MVARSPMRPRMDKDSIPRRLVEIYSKPDCSLCETALAAVKAVQRRTGFDLVERDVREDPALFERWRYDIPVVCIDGVAVLRGRVTEEAFACRLTLANLG